MMFKKGFVFAAPLLVGIWALVIFIILFGGIGTLATLKLTFFTDWKAVLIFVGIIVAILAISKGGGKK